MNKRFLLLSVMLLVIMAMSASTAFAGKPAPSPTVAITAPASGATVSGTAVAISADCASGGTGYTVTGVTYNIDSGANVAMSGPNGSASGTWTANWDSTAVGNGSHTIAVTATNSGSKTATQTITVNVSNNPHADLLWSEYPSNCLSCHRAKFDEMYQAVHYQWSGDAPDMLNQPTVKQGKYKNAVNSYCINILGNWQVCGKCHAGRGAEPVATTSPTDTQLKNIDCLMCHNEAYALDRDRLSDGSMGPKTTDEATRNSYVRSMAKPTKTNCLKCHAFAGGGDAVKRGDLTWAHRNTGDSVFDVHMSTARGKLTCQACHKFVNHKVTGKGSDLRATDYAAEVKCSTSTCHSTKETATGHTTVAVNKHIARVACQTCHIPVYAKDASDSTANEATEMHRSWKEPSVSTAAPYHPPSTKANNQIPKYKFWNRKSANALLNDVMTLDPITSAYLTSRPDGAINGALGTKLYAFKYKTAEQPMRTANNILIALDTKYYMLTTPDAVEATKRGLTAMGYNSTDAFSWAITGTYGMLNHEVPTKDKVLACASCHENTTQMSLIGELGYNLKNTQAVLCAQCHNSRAWKGYVAGHDRHVTSKGYDCSWCHSFSRPERGLKMP
ncbi:MAG: Ig-like domain-containing protein [Candidatus Aquicultor sp.]|nr:Ig-like domain-containing protein [Candidatus Aquicultor sp.]